MDVLKRQCRELLPDTPVWIEARDLLSREETSLIGGEDVGSFVVWSVDDELGVIIGTPAQLAIVQASGDCPEMLTYNDNIDFVRSLLPHYLAEPATILSARNPLPSHYTHPCRLLRPDDAPLLDHLSAELRKELSDVLADGTLLLAAFDHDLPVAFSYVASETESLWDVSIDTAETHRRQGFASAAVCALDRIMREKNKCAVWGAAQSNPASLALALTLGFEPVDSLWLLSRS